MSLILDALRKMEQERRSRRGSAQDLRPEVLRYRLAAQPKEPRRFPVAVIAGVVLLLAGVGAGFLLKGHAPQPAAEATLAPPTPVAAAPSAAPAATVAPPIAADVPVPAPAVAPAVADKAPAAVPPLVVPPARKSSRAAAAQFAPPAPPQSAAQEPAAAAGAPQDITISGIAYQDERRMRRAVLNGILVGEGAEVGGARVLEIKETKVKLSRGGRVFEVPFSSGLQSR
ncbi:general secretion pathway protein GspB [Geomonas subterranea]|uniref:general secretion pathway protein GspB n=1 Tax=Geomonas subterranea TaxID=2847989 RepID=UPI001CD5236E|nr:general secretion pathway protein GspB [Geomonas fuzhouensis]